MPIVLAAITADPLLKSIPVVVLTASRAEQDTVEGYRLQANAYVTKPVDLEQLVQNVQTIESVWLTIVTLPNAQAEP